MKEIGFIGMGNMGYAMLKGLLQDYDKESVVFSCPTISKGEIIMQKTGVAYVKENSSCVLQAKYIVLAIKPFLYDEVLGQIKPYLDAEKILISLAPGISIEEIRGKIENKAVRIVRAMPNTPALVGEGMTGVCYDEAAFIKEEELMLERIFGSFGKMKKVPERLMNAVVCASGSSPAYVYLFIEALADSVVKYGLTRSDAYELVAQTVLGAAKMVLETKEHPGKLKDDVCSPGGTTIRAVEALEANGLRNALFQATKACYDACEKK